MTNLFDAPDREFLFELGLCGSDPLEDSVYELGSIYPLGGACAGGGLELGGGGAATGGEGTR